MVSWNLQISFHITFHIFSSCSKMNSLKCNSCGNLFSFHTSLTLSISLSLYVCVQVRVSVEIVFLARCKVPSCCCCWLREMTVQRKNAQSLRGRTVTGWGKTVFEDCQAGEKRSRARSKECNSVDKTFPILTQYSEGLCVCVCVCLCDACNSGILHTEGSASYFFFLLLLSTSPKTDVTRIAVIFVLFFCLVQGVCGWWEVTLQPECDVIVGPTATHTRTHTHPHSYKMCDCWFRKVFPTTFLPGVEFHTFAIIHSA